MTSLVDVQNGQLMLRQATAADIDPIIALSDACFSDFGEYGETTAWWAARPGMVTAVAVRSDRIVGFVIYGYLVDGERVRGEVIAIAVDSAERRLGVGRALLSLALESLVAGAEAAQCADAYVTVAQGNHAARTLVEGAGFRLVGTDQAYPNGEVALRLSMGLATY